VEDLSGVQLHLVETLDDALDFRRWASERRPVLGLDSETTGLHWWSDTLRLVQIGDAHTGWAIPWHLWAGVVVEVLSKYEGDIVLHNAPFDLKFLRRNGVTLKRHQIHDTQTMHQLIDPVGRHALKVLAVKYLDRTAAGGQSALEDLRKAEKWSKAEMWRKVPWDHPAYWIYSAMDPVLNCRLFEKFKGQIDTQFRDLYDIEMASELIFMDAAVRGMPVDLDYTSRKVEELNDFVEQIQGWVKDEYGCTTTDRQVAARLIRDGVPLTDKTPTGLWKMDEGVLARFASTHPLAQAVLDMRKARKFSKTYFQKILELADGNVVHCDIRTIGARTGRSSISDPPLQQLPSGDPLVRDCFLAEPGMTFISCDFDQIEMRLLAHITQDPGLLSAFHSGEDFFVSLAKQLFNDPSIVKGDPRRAKAKLASYGKAYGFGPDHAADQLGISIAEAKAFISLYDAQFPGVKNWVKGLEREIRHRAATTGEWYIDDITGYRHPIDEGLEYRGGNYSIQGPAARIFKRAVVNLDLAGLADYLLLPVHDETISMAPKEDAEAIAREISSVMSDTDTYSVPLTTDFAIMERWGDKYRAH
jgi:DNA polymerase-1